MSDDVLDEDGTHEPAGAADVEINRANLDPGHSRAAIRRSDGRAHRDGEASPADVRTTARRQANQLPRRRRADTLAFQTPLFAAEHADVMERQRLIAEYEQTTNATLIVLIDQIFQASPTYLEELIFGADRTRPLHILLASPGGDGEIALRMLNIIHSRFSGLTIIVPDMAKSAATLLCLGANELLLGPGADLGPVDPQFVIGDRGLASAKEIIAAIDEAESRVAKNGESLPLFSTLLVEVNMLMLQQARNALDRSSVLVREALACVTSRTEAELDTLADKVRKPLIDDPVSHSSAVSARQAKEMGLPVRMADLESLEWEIIWTLWTRYFAIGCFPRLGCAAYESRTASMVIPPEP